MLLSKRILNIFHNIVPEANKSIDVELSQNRWDSFAGFSAVFLHWCVIAEQLCLIPKEISYNGFKK